MVDSSNGEILGLLHHLKVQRRETIEHMSGWGRAPIAPELAGLAACHTAIAAIEAVLIERNQEAC